MLGIALLSSSSSEGRRATHAYNSMVRPEMGRCEDVFITLRPKRGQSSSFYVVASWACAEASGDVLLVREPLAP